MLRRWLLGAIVNRLLPAVNYRVVYSWQSGGYQYHRAYCVGGYNRGLLPYVGMVAEALLAFPALKLSQIELGVITKSRHWQGCTVIHFPVSSVEGVEEHGYVSWTDPPNFDIA